MPLLRWRCLSTTLPHAGTTWSVLSTIQLFFTDSDSHLARSLLTYSYYVYDCDSLEENVKWILIDLMLMVLMDGGRVFLKPWRAAQRTVIHRSCHTQWRFAPSGSCNTQERHVTLHAFLMSFLPRESAREGASGGKTQISDEVCLRTKQLLFDPMNINITAPNNQQQQATQTL